MARRAPVADAAPTGVPFATLELITQVLHAAADGDLERRVPAVGPELEDLRTALNRVLDVVDAYVRESGATLEAASHGRYHRQLLTRGLPGTFRGGARRIDGSREQLAGAAAALAGQQEVRDQVVDQAVEVSSHVAAASVELGASAATLAESSRAGLAQVEAAGAAVQALEDTSRRIGEAAGVIRDVAARTRLLALNATIEAAHAGHAGAGFAVVAGEVRRLADEAAASSDRIAADVAAAQQAATHGVEVLAGLGEVMQEMDGQVVAIAQAAGDAGLARLAEQLRDEVGRVAEV
ncbi:MAG: chemotaxis protein [Cellulomonas iranensis]|uniref:Methyl-accepting chemotaxis protein n=1 Tax=Cellulomonas iranensis TaxID=76862 RepID=A0ABU0GHM6_9CELL|nr:MULTISPECIES: methyl-accepting chemotaxis protein [Cellulomonas]MBO9568430.1 chemotaxis protein [Cellulomonas iranensis]MDQ0424849.1 methyl-accepting chemotaxis protein [Cellulomonas iranensis]TFH69981.1 chemotaxis protein [Cellulomonas sp. HD19AZ1]UCN14306.1 methyl-accepting chemotaxis protein [Cellulomonas iranensis]